MNSSTSTDCPEISFWTPEDGFEKTLAIGIRTLEESRDEISRLLARGQSDPVHRYHFPSYDMMHKILAPNRMAIIRAMIGVGPVSIREVARRVGRDFKGVHSDVTTLRNNGLLWKATDGNVVFPFRSLQFEYEVSENQSAA
jgi:predicted transcriptional regulator